MRSLASVAVLLLLWSCGQVDVDAPPAFGGDTCAQAAPLFKAVLEPAGGGTFEKTEAGLAEPRPGTLWFPDGIQVATASKGTFNLALTGEPLESWERLSDWIDYVTYEHRLSSPSHGTLA